MQNYIFITLLSLNLIGVLYLIIRSSIRPKVDIQKEFTLMRDLYLKLNENNSKLRMEISKLSKIVDANQIKIQEIKVQAEVEGQPISSNFKTTNLFINDNNEKKLLLNDRFKEIFELHEKGLSVEQIARKMEKGNDEVSFILQLANQAQS